MPGVDQLPKNIYGVHTYRPIDLLLIAIFLPTVIAVTTMISKIYIESNVALVVINTVIVLGCAIMYFRWKALSMQHVYLTINPGNGVGFEAQFIETTRYRYKVSKQGCQPISTTSINTLSCNALYLTWEPNKDYTWIFVESLQPGSNEFYIQIIPGGITRKENSFSNLDYQLERKTTVYGKTIASIRNRPSEQKQYRFNLLLPFEKFDINEIEKDLSTCGLFPNRTH